MSVPVVPAGPSTNFAPRNAQGVPFQQIAHRILPGLSSYGPSTRDVSGVPPSANLAPRALPAAGRPVAQYPTQIPAAPVNGAFPGAFPAATPFGAGSGTVVLSNVQQPVGGWWENAGYGYGAGYGAGYGGYGAGYGFGAPTAAGAWYGQNASGFGGVAPTVTAAGYRPAAGFGPAGAAVYNPGATVVAPSVPAFAPTFTGGYSGFGGYSGYGAAPAAAYPGVPAYGANYGRAPVHMPYNSVNPYNFGPAGYPGVVQTLSGPAASSLGNFAVPVSRGLTVAPAGALSRGQGVLRW